LAQSNAIIRYLANGSPLLPTESFAAAKVDEWLAWEQYSHEPYVAVGRFQMVYQGRRAEERDGRVAERGEAALDVMERWLTAHTWFANEGFSIADVALYAYTHLAEEGGFLLKDRPAIRAWIARTAQELHANP
jgi:glutathione S-transferase